MKISHIAGIQKQFDILHSTFYILIIHLLTTDADVHVYDSWVRAHPNSNLWQSLAWMKYQQSLGKEVRLYATMRHPAQQPCTIDTIAATALVTVDTTTGGLSTWDIARGPLARDPESATRLVEALLQEAKRQRCIALYCSPWTPLHGIRGLRISDRHVQPRATRVIDLTQGEEHIRTQMHQKGRYNIRHAEKSGVTVRQGSIADLDAIYDLLITTAKRDGFVVAQKSQYAHFIRDMRQSLVLIAEYDQKPIAALLGVVWQTTGIYYYGASSYEHRARMAPYLLQWKAIQWCMHQGCTSYDLLGVSPEPCASNDPWRGISDFKRKFGGALVSYLPEHVCVLRPLIVSALRMKRAILG